MQQVFSFCYYTQYYGVRFKNHTLPLTTRGIVFPTLRVIEKKPVGPCHPLLSRFRWQSVDATGNTDLPFQNILHTSIDKIPLPIWNLNLHPSLLVLR